MDPPEQSYTIHLENTLRSAIARKSRGPFSSLASGFLRNTRRIIFHASGTRHSPLNRFSNQCATSYTVRRWALQHFRHQTVGRPVGLVPRYLTKSPQNVMVTSWMVAQRSWRASRRSLLLRRASDPGQPLTNFSGAYAPVGPTFNPGNHKELSCPGSSVPSP